MYDALETGVMRADMWRYTALYLYGGVYADVDIVAKPPIVELVNAHLNRSGVVFVESLPSPWLLGFFVRFLYLTDMVRVPQYRNCIMVARQGLPLMKLTLDAIVLKFKNPPPLRPAEPAYTLELTGPGVFTDAIKAVSGRALGGAASLSPPEALPRPAHPEGAELVNRYLSSLKMDLQKTRGARRYVDVSAEGPPRFPGDPVIEEDGDFDDSANLDSNLLNIILVMHLILSDLYMGRNHLLAVEVSLYHHKVCLNNIF